jgi:hypothetical protein
VWIIWSLFGKCKDKQEEEKNVFEMCSVIAWQWLDNSMDNSWTMEKQSCQWRCPFALSRSEIPGIAGPRGGEEHEKAVAHLRAAAQP